MSDYHLICEGDLPDLIQVCRQVLVAKSGNIKNIDLEKGQIIAKFRYGLNVNGLQMTLSILPLDDRQWKIGIHSEFTNAVDWTEIAGRKAIEVLGLIEQRITQSDQPETSFQQDLVYALDQVKKTSIVTWTTIVLIALVVTAIPSGFGIFLVPLLGLVGAMVALPLSRWLAKRAHGVVVIDRSEQEMFWLYDLVAHLANKANIPMPEVGVYDSPDMNAFASGATPQSSVIAFSTGLLEHMTHEEIKAVAAHEIGHIISNDMRGMAILTGLVSSCVLLFTLPLQALRVLNLFNDSFSWLIEWVLWLSKLILSAGLTFLGSLLVKKYSRNREYKADAIASLLVGKQAMIDALTRLKQDQQEIPLRQSTFNAFKISNNRISWSEILSTHPSLEKRIVALTSQIHSPT